MADADRCLKCNRDMDGLTRHWPGGGGVPPEIVELRAQRGDRPLCTDCLPDQYKRPFLGGGRPIIDASDLPAVGDAIPAHVVVRS